MSQQTPPPTGQPVADQMPTGDVPPVDAPPSEAPPSEAAQGDDYDVFRNVGQGLTGHYREIMIQYWQELINEIELTNEPGSAHHDDFKSHSLPFARIRKVMKTDEDVRMISAEAPIIFAKACEIFITELTMRAWCIAEKNKRRTLQKADIAEALKQSDMFDFLIDIVPRTGP
ncbi:Hap5 protein [Maudiozyma humilis]|uniref:Hap5 protein n=1 Tax=Maudiozyma humilis TaxID=51915 RepID=A0AAV5S689_MAUHU|nr:Hap5 protein [Kazachstania humilis]